MDMRIGEPRRRGENSPGAEATPATEQMYEAQAIPATGRIDLHCHLLPGIDDGCQTIEQSLQCIRRWQAAGFVGSVCTPHVGPSWYRHNTPDNIARWIGVLREAVAEAELDYRLWDGGEVRISEETVEWFSYWGLPTLGSGECVLLDWWGDHWPDFATEACEFLLDNGYQPILAHPERMGLRDDDFERVLARLEDIGVWLQGNFNSLSGGEGPLAEQRAKQLLAEDRYFVLATDTHGPDGVATRLAGLDAACDKFGGERMNLLLETRQREILKPRVPHG